MSEPSLEQLNRELTDENLRLRAAFKAIAENVGTEAIVFDVIEMVAGHVRLVLCFPSGDEMAAITDLLNRSQQRVGASPVVEPLGTARGASDDRE